MVEGAAADRHLPYVSQDEKIVYEVNVLCFYTQTVVAGAAADRRLDDGLCSAHMVCH